MKLTRADRRALRRLGNHGVAARECVPAAEKLIAAGAARPSGERWLRITALGRELIR